MWKSSLLGISLAFYLISMSLSKSVERQISSQARVRLHRSDNSNEERRPFDPNELEKPLLDQNSPEEEYAERTIVFLDGKKTKPKNINRKRAKFMETEELVGHYKRTENGPKTFAKRNREKKIFIKNESMKWPQNIIPYKFNYGTYHDGTNVASVFSTAVDRFNSAGCVKWVPRTWQHHFVEINGNISVGVCVASTGFQRYGVHAIYMSEYGCDDVRVALHEMMHIAGAMHRQSREVDRNKVLSFNWADISKAYEFIYAGYDLHNFREYDLGSVLQYGLSITNETQMILNDPDLEYLIGSNQNDLSFYDKAELNAFYKCADNCTNPPVCQNGGFVKQVDGVCSCECVDGLTGTDCSQLNTSRGCGGTFNLLTSESAFIDMIGYKRDLSCTWLIKGPEKTKIQVFINSIELPLSTYGNCYHFIEIRDYLSGAKGKQICGNSGGETFTKKNIGPTNVMILRFNSALYNAVRPGKGFTLTATATPSACSSSPCKYPATCKDGPHIDMYTCSCTEGYSGTNCNIIAADATVTDSFERDFTTLFRHSSKGVDFRWSTNKYWELNGVNITAFDGFLMATLMKYPFTPGVTYRSDAKLVTSVRFTKAERCLRFNYALADNDIGGPYTTTLKVRILSDIFTPDMIFATNSGNNWTSAEMDLPAVNGMKIQFVGSYGIQRMVLDNIRITPLLCWVCGFHSQFEENTRGPWATSLTCGTIDKKNPCNNVVCQNGGTCKLVFNSTNAVQSRCSCQFGFYGAFCEKYICNENSCLNGVCFPHYSSTYTCKCNAGWSGNKCDINVCANVDCNQGKCEALSETETRCNCDAGWYGEFCDINPCEQIDCNKGFCEVVSMFEARCVCLYGWVGIVCNKRLFGSG